MRRTFLLPHPCKVAGWVVFAPLAALWLLYVADGLDGDLMNFAPFGDGLGNLGRFGSAVAGIVDWQPTAFMLLVAASMMAVAFSRERDEDEYVASVRARSLMVAFWVDFAVFVVAAVAVKDLDFLYIMATQMFLVLFLHIAIFNVAMAAIRRGRSHEE